MSTRATLMMLNVLGGIAVLGSYVWGLRQPEVAAGLWGHVPESLRGLYTVNMLLAAAGYFPFTGLLVLASDEARFRAEASLPYAPTVLSLYALVLVASALWLPLTSVMIASPGTLLWLAIRIDLALVGLGALGILMVCVRIARARGGVLAWSAVVGALPFVLQTAVLDALIWPYYWFA